MKALSLAVLMAAQPAAAQEAPQVPLEGACRTSLEGCRHDVAVKLRREKGEPYEQTFALMPPSVQNGLLVLLPGESVHVAGKRRGDRLADLRLVEEGAEHAIEVKFEQQTDGTGMLLTVKNPFDQPLRFRAGVQWLDGPERLMATSICPVQPGLMSFEMWPQPIFQIALADFELLGEKDDLSCRE